MLQTFVSETGGSYPSHDWGHDCRTMAEKDHSNADGHKGTKLKKGSVPVNLCEIVAKDRSAEEKCREFYETKFNEIKCLGKLHLPICQCPMGLTIMFEPVASERHLFGVLACGGWREAGTEGAILYGVSRHVVDDQVRVEAEEAVEGIQEFGPRQFETARITLDKVIKYLDHFYDLAYDDQRHRREEELVKDMAKAIRNRFRTLGNLEADLENVLSVIAHKVDVKLLAIYVSEASLQNNHDLEFELAGWWPHNFSISERFVAKNSQVEHLKNRADDEGRLSGDDIKTIRTQVSTNEVDFARVHRLTDSRMALFLCKLSESDLPHQTIERVWHDLAYALQNAARLDEAEYQSSRLRLLADTARHSLNNPLQGVRFAMGRLLRIVRSNQPGEELEKQAKKIGTFVDQASAVVDGLSGASLQRASVVRDQANFGIHDLNPIIFRSIQPYRLAGKQRSIRISLNLGDLPRVECDREQMRLLFMNLVENAVKYSHANKTVEITGRVIKDGSVELVEISISDFGLGIPERLLERIFEPYFQVPIDDAKRTIRGTGLGLFLCKSIVDRHGGTIRASTEIPSWKSYLPEEERLQGCKVVFKVRIPIRQKQ